MVKKIGQDETKAKHVTCNNCGSKLEYYPREVVSKTYCTMGESDVVTYIVCPECKGRVEVH